MKRTIKYFSIRNYFVLLIYCSFLHSLHSLEILFWLNEFPTGTGWSSLNLMVGFLKEKHNITILAQKINDSSINNNHPDIIKYDLMSKVYEKTLPEGKKNFDIILCQSAGLAVPLLEFQKTNNVKGRRIVFVRGADLRLFFNPQINKKICSSFDRIVPVCDYFKRELAKVHCAKEVTVVHSSIDCKKFVYKERKFPKDGKIKIITTSRLARKKGLPNAIRAVKRVIGNYPNVEYTIVGSGNLEKELQSLIKSLRLEKKIKLIGQKTPAEIVKLLHESHIFILPSVTTANGSQEGIANALKEAMATGMPVVSTYHGGNRELIINGKSGFLVRERDEKALAAKIEFLIRNPSVWKPMGLAGRKFIENYFDRERENKKFIDMCLKLSQSSS